MRRIITCWCLRYHQIPNEIICLILKKIPKEFLSYILTYYPEFQLPDKLIFIQQFAEVEDVLNFPNLEWNYSLLSSQINASYWEIKDKEVEKYLDYSYLSINPNITWDIVKNNADKPWNYLKLTQNPNITIDIIKENPKINWDYNLTFLNPSISFLDILKHLELFNLWVWMFYFYRIEDFKYFRFEENTITLEFEEYKKIFEPATNPLVFDTLSQVISYQEFIENPYSYWDQKKMEKNHVIDFEGFLFLRKEYPEISGKMFFVRYYKCRDPNPMIFDLVKQHPTLNWNLELLCQHPKLNYKDVLLFSADSETYKTLSLNLAISEEDILGDINKPWDICRILTRSDLKPSKKIKILDLLK